MSKKEIDRVKKLISGIKIRPSDSKYLVTLKFPDPSADIFEADDVIKKHLDNIRKQFPCAFTVLVAAFVRDGVGLHYHGIVVDRGEVNYVLGDRYLPDQDRDGSRIRVLQKNDSMTKLEYKIRHDWTTRVKRIHRFYKQDLSDVVDVRSVEIDSGNVCDYITRVGEREVPREWEHSTISWVKIRGEKNYLLEED